MAQNLWAACLGGAAAAGDTALIETSGSEVAETRLLPS